MRVFYILKITGRLFRLTSTVIASTITILYKTTVKVVKGSTKIVAHRNATIKARAHAQHTVKKELSKYEELKEFKEYIENFKLEQLAKQQLEQQAKSEEIRNLILRRD